MLKGIFNFLFSCAFVALLPAFWLAARFWGSADERWLMRIAMLALMPFCVTVWLIILRKGKWSSLLAIPLGYVLIVFLLKAGVL